MLRNLSIWCAAALILLATACDRQSSETTQQDAQVTQPTPTPTAPSAPPPTAKINKGTVVETMNSGNYTYILVDDGSEQSWVALLKSSVNVGEEITYYDGMVMQNFVSSTLDRTFDKIIFSNGLVVGEVESQVPQPASDPGAGNQESESFAEALQKEAQNIPGQTPAIAGPGSRKAVVPFSEVQVGKATGENSYTVGELYEKADDLNGKTIMIKGKVMKISANIMGMNWIHIQDGTGDPSNDTHDLVVTTTVEPKDSWDVITVNGIVRANKNFGAGYSYAVIVEEAKINE